MKYWKQGFYDEPVEGGVEITDERWLELIDGQAAGMLITEDEQGSPVLTEYVNSVRCRPTNSGCSKASESGIRSTTNWRYSASGTPSRTSSRPITNTPSNAKRRQKSRCNYDWKNTTPEIYGSGAQSGQSLTTRWRGRLRIRHGSS